MECAICYEKFFTPKSQKEFEKIYNEIVKNNNYNEIMKFKTLLSLSLNSSLRNKNFARR